MKRLKIFVCGPYSADTEAGRVDNTVGAIDTGVALMKLGHLPLVPHLYHTFDRRARDLGESFTWPDYMRLTLAYLEGCDALFYLGSSRGADLELACAERLGMPVYTDLRQVAAAAELNDLVPETGRWEAPDGREWNLVEDNVFPDCEALGPWLPLEPLPAT